MWRFESCPKCSGDLSIDWDKLGWYVQCLQRGYQCNQNNALPAMKEVVQKERKLARTGSGKIHAK